MDVSAICQRIFSIAAPLADAARAPVAGINIGVTEACPFSDQELWKEFNKVRWDTNLASAELQILHKEGNYGIKVLSLELFEEEEVAENTIPVTDGLIC